MCTLPVTRAGQLNELVVCYALPELPRDFKRVLRVQFKEFMHYLDDSNCELLGNSLSSVKISAK